MKPNPIHLFQKCSKKTKYLILLLGLTGVSIPAYFLINKNASTETTKDRYHQVARGDFNISIVTKGELAAIKNYPLSFEGKGLEGLEITQIVKDRQKVLKGQPLITFSSVNYIEKKRELEEELKDLHQNHQESLIDKKDSFLEDIEDFKIELSDTKQDLQLFLEQDKIDQDTGIGKLTEFADKYLTAKEALVKYKNLESKSQRSKNKTAVDDGEELYHEALANLEKTRKALDEAQLKDPEVREKLERSLNTAEKKVANLEAAWENARKNIQKFRKFDYPQRLRQLNAGLLKAQLALKKEIVQVANKEAQAERAYRKHLREIEKAKEAILKRQENYDTDLERTQANFQKSKKRLELRISEYQHDIENLIIRAPVDGIFTLDSRFKELKVGDNVRPKQILAKIPDLSQFMVSCDIPEANRSKIKNGLTCKMRSSAIPDLLMEGNVKTVAVMSHRSRGFSTMPRFYQTSIETLSTDPRLMPGMTVEVEILVEKADDVLFLPIESLYHKEGETYCRVKNFKSVEERKIEAGRSSRDYVEITSGITEGETVLVHQETSQNNA